MTLVLLHHGLQPIEFGGFVGVDMFFALSGFLITRNLLLEKRTTGSIDLPRFYWRRLVRLYPPLLVAIAVILPFGLLLRGLTRHLAEVLLAVTYLTPIAGEFFGWGGQIWLHTWSLGIEEIFYLVWPVTLIALLHLRWRRLWITVGAAAIMICAAQIFLVFGGHEPSYFLRSGGMLFGCSFALWRRSHRSTPIPASVGPAGVLAIAWAVVVGGADHWDSVSYAAAALGTIGVIACVVANTEHPFRTALSLGPVVYVGKISYELYLLHYPVLVCILLATGTDNLNAGAWYGIPIAIVLAAATERALRTPIARLRVWQPIR